MFKLFYESLWSDPYGTPSLIYRVFADYGRRHAGKYAFAIVLMGIAAACTSLTAYLIGLMVNDTYLSRSFATVIAFSVVTIILFTVKGLAMYGQALLMTQINTELTAEGQQRLFDKLLQENLAYFAAFHSSHFMAQTAYSVAAVPAVLSMLINSAGRDALLLVGLTVVMIIQDPLMSLFGILVMPPAMLFLRDLVHRVRKMSFTQFTASAGILETMQETLHGMRVVKAFGLEDEMRRRVAGNSEMIKRVGLELARLSNRSSPMMEALGGCVIALVFLYGGYRVINLGATPGEFVSFVTAFLLAYEPAKRLARLHLDLNMQLEGVRLLFHILDAPPTEPADNDRPSLSVGAGRIAFEDVEFAYRPSEPVLRSLSFVAEPGRVTALVGHSGGGKSTIFNLILRFYEPAQGAVVIDGQNIGLLSRGSVRRQVAYVGQDIFLFRGSVRENIAVGSPQASEAEIVAAAEAAHAHGFITSFPQGYDTPVGEHGLQLSAGQRQRIAIARALIKDAPIILLDEPTAALDAESEEQVQSAIARLCAGRTVLVIAHRLSTIMNADRIHVVHHGVVVESGRHHELLYRAGFYAALYRLQFKDTDPLEAAVSG